MSSFDELYRRVLGKWPGGAEPGWVDSRFGRTRVNAVGPEDGVPVVLLSGAGATSTVWFDCAAALVAAGCRVIAVDVPGDAGLSEAGAERLDPIVWIDEILDDIGLQASAFVGHSYGAQVVLAYTLARPTRASRAVLLDPNASFGRMSFAYLLRSVPYLMRPTASRFRRLLTWETVGRVADSDWLALTVAAADTFRVTDLVIPKRPKASQLAGVGPRLTVLLAEKSRVHNVAEIARSVHRLVPEARVEVIPESPHHTMPLMPGVASAVVRGVMSGEN